MSIHSDDDNASFSSQISEDNPAPYHDQDHNSATGSSHGSASSEDRVKFVQKESRQVCFLRVGVVVLLLLAATTVSVLVFTISTKAESKSMGSNFDAAAEKIIDTFMDIANVKMGTAGSLVVSLVAHGIAMGHEWPFVTVPSFQERASTVMKLSGALYIGVNPVVPGELRETWENYSNHGEAAAWYNEAREYQRKLGIDEFDNRPQVETDDPDLDLSSGVANHIYDYDRETIGAKGYIASIDNEYHPIWQTSPVTRRAMINQNRATNSVGSLNCLREDAVIFLGMQYSNPGYGDDETPKTAEMAWLLSTANRAFTKYEGDIFSTIYFPIYTNFTKQRETVGVMRVVFHWARYFENILPESKRGIVVVLENNCDDPFTYQIDGQVVSPLGHGDLHDRRFEKYMRSASFENVTWIEDGTAQGLRVAISECPYKIRVYPSTTFSEDYASKTPAVITLSVACVFVFTVFTFFLYDTLVERRQRLLVQKATQTHQIVSSLFPKNVRDRLLEEGEENTKKGGFIAPNQRIKTFLTDGDRACGSQVIADLFPHATVLFADISGFTAWSSSREPAQVFILLQSVYQAFDKIAKQRKVFKVETIGDSYVAATGCPEPQTNHALIMARFAMECNIKMTEIVRNLETSLGPDTGELKMRFGINSGPVTAGVLRGERSRFQLFGDTMNTAARMESTGIPGKIQASQSTADLLIASGKGHWVSKRDDSVIAKGKGILQTYWITPRTWNGTSNASSETASSHNDAEDIFTEDNDGKTCALLKREREIDWIVEILLERLRPIVAKHQAQNKTTGTAIMPRKKHNQIALDEFQDAIKLPDFDTKIAAATSTCSVEIGREIVSSVREYVAIISSTYRDNPFHNFEHACHVTMCVNKFLKRIVSPEMEENKFVQIKDQATLAKKVALHLHDYTHGIHSDPITMFGIVFSAVIHDADHRGISNAQLIKEEPNMGATFRNKSVAEQNSLEIAWSLLMSDRFKALREYVFVESDEIMRFRQVMVNAVLATDIFDKEFNDIRKARWERAFYESSVPFKEKATVNALRATIVLEHIIQASDVCHTMQHWHVYRKWNRNLFFEMKKAYQSNRLAMDPATFWYSGELKFFDNYVLPLAKKLKECNVFGVSSDECLNYAMLNRAEWNVRGEALVAEMIDEFHKTSGM